MNAIVFFVLLFFAYKIGKHMGRKVGYAECAHLASLEQVAATKNEKSLEHVNGMVDVEVAIRQELQNI